MKYIVVYTDGYAMQERSVVIVFNKINASWRELQQHFDPKYRCDNLRFFPLGEEIEFKQGD